MLKKLLIALTVLFVALLVADLVVGRMKVDEEGNYKGRPLPPFGRWSTPKNRTYLERELADPQVNRDRIFNGFDSELGWINRTGEYQKDGTSYFNSIAARGKREYPATPDEGTLRIASFGESFTFGSEVSDDKCWPALMESLDERVECINLGVGGYGTDQALMRYRRDGRELGAHVVTLGLMLENIGRNVNRDRSLFYPQTNIVVVKPRFVLKGGELEVLPLPFETYRDAIQASYDGSIRGLLREHEYWEGDDPLVPFSNISRIIAWNKAYARRDTRKLWMQPKAEPFQVTLAILEAFHREALADGADHALVLIFPAKRDITFLKNSKKPYWRHLLKALDDRDIPYIDLATHIADLAKSGDIKKTHLVAHLSPQANKKVAERVLEWALDASGLEEVLPETPDDR